MTKAPVTMPPFPKHPSPKDWSDAVAIVGECLTGNWRSTSLLYSDPLGYLVAVARDRMRTRHCNTPGYLAFLADLERQRVAAAAAAEVRRRQREQAMTEKEKAEEETFYANGGTDIEWAIQQDAAAQAKADAAKKRALTRTRTKARSAPARGRTSAT